MRRLVPLTPCGWLCLFISATRMDTQSCRYMATQAFASSMEKLQGQLQSAGARRQELTRQSRNTFETESLDDLQIAYTPQLAARIAHTASTLHVIPARSPLLQAVLEASTSDAAILAMDADSLARIVHSCLVLRSSVLFNLLISYIRPLIIMATSGSMNAVSVAVLINAYGRAGVHHDALYKALCDCAAKTMVDPSISLGHVTNVAFALSRVHYNHGPLMLILRDHALSKLASASPMVAITMLDAFAELNFVDADFFGSYERHVLSRLPSLSPPLLASLLNCLVLAGRGSEATMRTIGEEVIARAASFDSTSLSRVCNAYVRAGVLAEEVLGALAERACAVVNDFRADEAAMTLAALAAFDLFDAELFPLLATRVSSLFRQGEHVSISDAATILASFASVQERNDELIHCCTQVFASYIGGASPVSARINALWACGVLNVRNEAQLKIVEEAKAHPELLTLPVGEASKGMQAMNAKERGVLEERRVEVAKIYGIPLLFNET